VVKKLNVPIDHNFIKEPSDRQDIFDASRSEKYWEYRYRWEYNPTNQIVEDSPIHIDIDITNKCNLKCQMCPRTDLVKRGIFWEEGYVDFGVYEEIISQGMENGLCSVKYNILGEPLIHPDLPDMIRYAKEIGIVDTMLNTNGTLLTEGLGIKLIESGLDKLFFSFDSPHEDVYNKIRAGASYHKVLNNIKRFIQIRNKMKSITPLTRASMVLMKENIHERDDFRTLFSPIVDFVAFSVYLKHIGQEEDEEKTIVNLNDQGVFCCPQLWQRMFIHTDGEVSVCCLDTTRTIKIGNIHDKSIKELWLGDEYKEIRDLHASGNYKKHHVCSVCPLTRMQVEV